jgi:hypothetical protein
MGMSIKMYIFDYDMVSEFFGGLGYPTSLIYPLAIAKILGLVAIWTNKIKLLKEWAYAGFFFDTVLAMTSHLLAEDGKYFLALLAIIMLIISYWSWKTSIEEEEKLLSDSV